MRPGVEQFRNPATEPLAQTLKALSSPPILPAAVALAQQQGVAHSAQAFAFLDQGIVLPASQPGLLLSLGWHPHQLDRLLIAIEIIEQVADQTPLVDLLILSPLPFL